MIALFALAALQVVQPAAIDPTAVQAQIAAAKATADAAKAKADAVQAAMPVASTSPPPMESVTPSAGTPGIYRPADAPSPRISRSALLSVTGSAGMLAGTWSTPLPAGYASYPVYFTPKGVAGAKPVKCTVITATNLGFTAQCMQDADVGLSLSLLTAAGVSGLVLPVSVYAPASTQVYALQLPSTQ